MSARADAVKAASGGSGSSGQDPRADVIGSPGLGWTEWVRVNGKVAYGISRWPAGVSTDDFEPTAAELAEADA